MFYFKRTKNIGPDLDFQTKLSWNPSFFLHYSLCWLHPFICESFVLLCASVLSHYLRCVKACPLRALPKPEHGKAGQMVAREVARAVQWARVCVCSVSQSHASPLDNGSAGPHWALGCGTKPRANNAGAAEGCDLETRADCDNSLAEWRGGRLVSVATSQCVNVTVLLAHPASTSYFSPGCSPDCSFPPPYTYPLFSSSKSLPPSWEKRHALVRYEDQYQEENKRIPWWFTMFCSKFGFWILAKGSICFDNPFWKPQSVSLVNGTLWVLWIFHEYGCLVLVCGCACSHNTDTSES